MTLFNLNAQTKIYFLVIPQSEHASTHDRPKDQKAGFEWLKAYRAKLRAYGEDRRTLGMSERANTQEQAEKLQAQLKPLGEKHGLEIVICEASDL